MIHTAEYQNRWMKKARRIYGTGLLKPADHKGSLVDYADSVYNSNGELPLRTVPEVGVKLVDIRVYKPFIPDSEVIHREGKYWLLKL
jgi:hypothetical protein